MTYSSVVRDAETNRIDRHLAPGDLFTAGGEEEARA
jgi:hypothetical protein